MTGVHRRNPKVEESPLQGELMLFEPEAGRFFVLNRTMAYVWRNCENRTIEQMLKALSDEFSGADGPQVVEDVRSAVEELGRLGLVTPA